MSRSKTTKLKKLTQADNNKTSGLLSTGLLQNFVRLTHRIGDFIKDKTIYQLFSIVLMFSDVDTRELKGLHLLKNKYMNTIRRKVDAQWREANRAKKRKGTKASSADSDSSDDDDDFESVNVGATIIDQFNACVCDVKELSTIIAKLGPPGGPPGGPSGSLGPEGTNRDLALQQSYMQEPP